MAVETGSPAIAEPVSAAANGMARHHLYIFAGLLAFGLVAPFVLYPVFLMKVMCFALFACAFNLLLGYGGLLSFGHAAFFGSASYVSAHAAKVWGLTPELAVLTGTIAGTGDEYVAGGAAYFAHVNAKGGIYGRKIRVVVKDDGYKPDLTLSQTKALLAEERPLALFGFVGTGNVLALNRNKVLEDAGVALVAPYTAEEMWERLGHAPTVARAGWPEVDESLLVEESVTAVVQIQGKVKARLEVAPDITEGDLEALALADPAVVRAVDGRPVRKVVVRAPKLVNVVV